MVCHCQSRAWFVSLLILSLAFTSLTLGDNQQQIYSFDDETPDNQPTSPLESSSAASSSSPAPIPTPSGLTAKVIKRVTGWNDSVVAKLTGEIPPKAPHPFVVEITDKNYEEVIQADLDKVAAGWGSDNDTVWVIAVVANDRISNIVDEEFDKIASNSSLAVNPPPPKKREDEITVEQLDPSDPFLFKPNIRFGRIDYMGKTDLILTKWLIFKCPILVVITKKGEELRFFKTGGVPPKAEHLAEFLRAARWAHKPIWNSTFSPGGSGEWIVVLMAKGFQGMHNLGDGIPGWLLMIISSMLGTSLMQWLHSTQSKNTKGAKKDSPKTSRNPEDPNALKKELAQAALELAEAAKKKSSGSQENPENNTVKLRQSSNRNRDKTP
ncbi:hypothetical protein BY996DRAFT_4578233 [Phakopsora pachyrhizi]|uniref:Uncharacterized protein n=1 Tax=Phakopsora pachyrhizi TaxID=170000 RepID=A0AAV0BQW6_PHAPC|nr:hypothetical protein BY996DRAFT_4578233 [Phakopsora pachyrhizi]CAH7689064.1 hypothetical protein PPACK8108_LOCUS24123 [Phakopsora pachyrhizi]